jgi:hypothetical protein
MPPVWRNSTPASHGAQLANGEWLDLLPVATWPDVGVSFFATLLPQPAGLVSVTAIGTDGQVLQPQDLAKHEEAWQRFLWRRGPSAGLNSHGPALAAT